MDDFERQVQRVARQMRYPVTPLIRWPAGRPPVRLQYARVLALLAVLAALVMISPLQAGLLEWLRIGVITLYFGDTPTPTPAMPSLLNLFGETTLEEAQQSIGFVPRLPADFGPPDRVYRQNGEGAAVILVWLAQADRPAISLYEFRLDSRAPIYGKLLSQATNTQVNGQPAAWVDVPHTLLYESNGVVRRQASFLIRGSVLIWEEGDVTYRLESTLTVGQAIAIAESLR